VGSARQRERARAKKKRRRQVGPIEQREGEMKRRGARARAPTGGARRGGPTGPNWLFHFLWNL
jgi:hypothetical protein